MRREQVLVCLGSLNGDTPPDSLPTKLQGGGRPSFPPLLSSERKKTLVVQSSGFISDKWLVPARFRFAMHENTFYSILGLGGECR